MDTLLNVLHVVTAVFIIGPVAILPMTTLRTLRAGDRTRTAAAAKSIRLLGYLSLIVVITGYGLLEMADAQYDLSITTPWVLASLILYVVALLLTLLVVVPAFQHAEGGNSRAIYVRAAAGSGIATLCLIAVVVLMVWKP